MDKLSVTLDEATARRLKEIARRRSITQSQALTEAIQNYKVPESQLSESEHLSRLKAFDEYMARPRETTQAQREKELREIRAARRSGRRLTRVEE